MILALIGVSVFYAGNIDDWKQGRAASEALRSVYAAQRGFLADNPRNTLGSLNSAALIPYLPDRTATLPSVEDLDGNPLSYNVRVSPPILLDSNGDPYDPSGDIDDSLWDVGSL